MGGAGVGHIKKTSWPKQREKFQAQIAAGEIRGDDARKINNLILVKDEANKTT